MLEFPAATVLACWFHREMQDAQKNFQNVIARSTTQLLAGSSRNCMHAVLAWQQLVLQ
jgi:hypothetical protein